MTSRDICPNCYVTFPNLVRLEIDKPDDSWNTAESKLANYTHLKQLYLSSGFKKTPIITKNFLYHLNCLDLVEIHCLDFNRHANSYIDLLRNLKNVEVYHLHICDDCPEDIQFGDMIFLHATTLSTDRGWKSCLQFAGRCPNVKTISIHDRDVDYEGMKVWNYKEVEVDRNFPIFTTIKFIL